MVSVLRFASQSRSQLPQVVVALVRQREAYVFPRKQTLRILTAVLDLCHLLLVRLYPRLSEGYNALRDGVAFPYSPRLESYLGDGLGARRRPCRYRSSGRDHQLHCCCSRRQKR